MQNGKKFDLHYQSPRAYIKEKSQKKSDMVVTTKINYKIGNNILQH